MASQQMNSSQYRRLLVEAVSDGDTRSVNSLLRRGVRVDGEWSAFLPDPLRIAAGQGNLDMATLLIQEGKAPPDGLGRNHEPICAAIKQGQLEMVRLLHGAGAIMGCDAFKIAIEKGNVDMAKLFIELGVPVNGDGPGETPLHVAARKGNVEIADLLIGRP